MPWSYIILGILLLLFLLLCYKYLLHDARYWKRRGVPNTKSYATLWERFFKRIPLHLLDRRLYQNFKASGKPYVGYVEFGQPNLIIIDPDYIRNIMVKDFDHFVNRRKLPVKGDEYFNKMLIMMEGEEWKDLRATLRPTFSTSRIRDMFSIFNGSANSLIQFLKSREPEQEIEINEPMIRYTIDVISSAAFGVDSKNFEDKDSVFAKMGQRFQEGFRGKAVYKLMFIILFPWLAQFFKVSVFDRVATQFLVRLIKKNIQYRESAGDKRNDFLQLLIDTKAGSLKLEDGVLDSFEEATLTGNQKKVQLTDDLIFAQCILFFVAGFETSQSLLIFALYELALNPNVQQKLYEETSGSIKGNNGLLSYETVNQMEYLDWVVSETLRKYPPLGRLGRRCTKDYKWPTGDFTVEKGTLIVIPSYSIHYDEEIFPEPQKFRPERFSPLEKSERHAYTYMPFGQGPRGCIGMRLALIEGKTALAKLVNSFLFEPSENTPIPMKYANTPTAMNPDKVYLKIKTRREDHQL